MTPKIRKPILIVGGYGVTGRAVVCALRRVLPDVPITIAGRNLEKARGAATELGVAAIAADASRPGLGIPDDLETSMVIPLLKDKHFHALDFAARRGVPYLTLSGATYDVGPDMAHGLIAARTCPVILAPQWFAGAVTQLVLLAAQNFAHISTLTVGITIDREAAGTSGEATKSDFAQIAAATKTTLARVDGQYKWETPDEAVRTFLNPDGATVQGQGAVALDVACISAMTGAENVSVVERWGESCSSKNGEKPADEIALDIAGTDSNGNPQHMHQVVTAFASNMPITALTVAFVVERALGLGQAPAPEAGLYLTEHLLDPEMFGRFLTRHGVRIEQRAL